ncbi:hypothetical protein [Tabrizicola sp.]|uniref:hypothetical protein n=1 Tax=Tabrizicola sp. TaxID=2005166 RepID=UPI003D27D5D2
MYDANLVEFYSRVSDLKKAHDKGFGHESPGTLSRAATYGLRKKRTRLRVMPLVFVAVAAVGLKATILHSVGEIAYQERVAALSAGQGFDRLGGWLMQVDPVTAYVAQQLGVMAMRLNG